MLFPQKEAFSKIKMSFYYSRKISIFSKELIHDFGQKFQISFRAYFSVNDVVFSKGSFLNDKNVILLWLKTFHISKGVTHDSRQKFQISFEPTFL